MTSQGPPSAWSAPLLMAGVGFSAFTSGTIASISLVTIPAILTNTTDAALLTCWRYAFSRGIQMGPPFAIAASAAHLYNAYVNRNSTSGQAKLSIAAAISTVAIVPFTMIFLAPTNTLLFKREEAARGTIAGVKKISLELVKKWGG